jgi:hypothetical protein
MIPIDCYALSSFRNDNDQTVVDSIRANRDIRAHVLILLSPWNKQLALHFNCPIEKSEIPPRHHYELSRKQLGCLDFKKCCLASSYALRNR